MEKRLFVGLPAKEFLCFHQPWACGHRGAGTNQVSQEETAAQGWEGPRRPGKGRVGQGMAAGTREGPYGAGKGHVGPGKGCVGQGRAVGGREGQRGPGQR